MDTRTYWKDNVHADGRYENFGRDERRPASAAPAPSEDEDYSAAYLKKGKQQQDPMSHRIIEKRRRDRMNNCLANLSRLIPPEYLKKGRGRVEKTEIIEMAIKHINYLQDRVFGPGSTAASEHYRAGHREAAAEAVSFLAQAHGYRDALCAQLTQHMQQHIDQTLQLQQHADQTPKAEPAPTPEKAHGGNSSETTSSSSSCGYQAAPRDPPRLALPYAPAGDPPYAMDCDGAPAAFEEDPARKTDHFAFNSYKFKNSIQRRFSRSQDHEEAFDMTIRGPAKLHKRRRASKPPPPSTSNSGSNEDVQSPPQETSSPTSHHHFEKSMLQKTQLVPIFALNAIGKYYVPLTVDYSCLAPHLGQYDVLDGRAAPLHPVTIHVNFQPRSSFPVKSEVSREWRPN